METIRIDSSPSALVWYNDLVGQTITVEKLTNEHGLISFSMNELTIEQQRALHDKFNIQWGSKLYLKANCCSILLTGLPLILKKLDEEIKNNIHS